MDPEPKCPRCRQVLAPEDTLDRDGDRVVHLDCRRPRRLCFEERTLLYQYCWDHTVAECVSCAQSFRAHELLSGLSGDVDLCPQCRTDLSDGVRAHLYGCPLLPGALRRRAQETRAAAQKLVKESGELCHKADVLMREAEAAIAALRAARRR